MIQPPWMAPRRAHRFPQLFRPYGSQTYLLAITDDELGIKVTAEVSITELLSLREWVRTEAQSRAQEVRNRDGS